MYAVCTAIEWTVYAYTMVFIVMAMPAMAAMPAMPAMHGALQWGITCALTEFTFCTSNNVYGNKQLCMSQTHAGSRKSPAPKMGA